jgi:hypothetical protein
LHGDKKNLQVRGLSGDRKNRCIVLLTLNVGSRDERSNFTLGVLPKRKNDVLENRKIFLPVTDI